MRTEGGEIWLEMGRLWAFCKHPGQRLIKELPKVVAVVAEKSKRIQLFLYKWRLKDLLKDRMKVDTEGKRGIKDDTYISDFEWSGVWLSEKKINYFAFTNFSPIITNEEDCDVWGQVFTLWKEYHEKILLISS